MPSIQTDLSLLLEQPRDKRPLETQVKCPKRKCIICFGRVSTGRLVMKAGAPQGDLFVSVFDMSRDLDCAQEKSKMSVSE